MRITSGLEQISAIGAEELQSQPYVIDGPAATDLQAGPEFQDYEQGQTENLAEPTWGAELAIDPWVRAKQREQDAAEAYRNARLGALHARIGQWAEYHRSRHTRFNDPAYIAALGRLVAANTHEEQTATELERASALMRSHEHPQASE